MFLEEVFGGWSDLGYTEYNNLFALHSFVVLIETCLYITVKPV